MRRRSFLAGLGASLLLRPLGAQARRPRVAFLGTEVRRHSHAQHFLDRLTVGYPWRGAWQDPRVEVASIYVDQFPENDLARERIARSEWVDALLDSPAAARDAPEESLVEALGVLDARDSAAERIVPWSTPSLIGGPSTPPTSSV